MFVEQGLQEHFRPPKACASWEFPDRERKTPPFGERRLGNPALSGDRGYSITTISRAWIQELCQLLYLKHPKLKAAAQQVGNPPGDHAPNLGGTGVLDDNCHVVRDSESQSAKGQFNQQLNDDDDHVGSVSSGNRIPRITIITMPLMPLQPQVTLRAGKI
jgi:hypothetical protein